MGRQYSNTILSGSRIRAADIAQLRTFIDQDLAAIGQSFPWTWSNVVAFDRVLAKHFKEMRDASQQLWNAKNRGPLPMWSSGVNPGGESLGTAPTRMFASDVTDLRIWLNQYEDNHPPALQGINTKVYVPNTDPSLDKLIAQSWAQDIADMRTQQPRLATRVNILVAAGQCDLTLTQENRYRDGLLRLKNAGLERPFVLLGWEFMPPPNCPTFGVPSAPLDPTDWANPYSRVRPTRAALCLNPVRSGRSGRLRDLE